MSSKPNFLHRRPAIPAKKARKGFLDLPGEVKNQIYQYYFQDSFRCEIVAKETTFDQIAAKSSKKIKFCANILNPKPTGEAPSKTQQDNFPAVTNKIRVSRRLGGRNQRVQGETTKWATSICPLILVCKSIHTETIPFLYRNTTFVFDAPKRMSRFLSTVPKKNLAYITKLELYYYPYLEPEMRFEGKNFTKAHHEAWIRTCKAMSKNLVNLQDLTLVIYGSYAKRYFDLRQDVVTPFLQFRRLAVGNGSDHKKKDAATLKTVKVDFTSRWSRLSTYVENAPIVQVSKALHKLYGEAIAKAILGATETEAMAELLEAWEGEYAMWQHHLDFLRTGW
ncbi:hypothetical protein DM02DRAFT_618229 [Periconia macrospinosa]|uniref:DUF7730 domain-containing protein n=1 Tax=Periconia macrospinosa TaxID=97972 RepID=A0A2V1DA80_9PLEO|nr:hypothetical protein DM02DRAFT_618229 [Periconia macrospinosa]